ncbi:MAG: hypothetical protein ABI137_01475 [Antricoccus sp.]
MHRRSTAAASGLRLIDIAAVTGTSSGMGLHAAVGLDQARRSGGRRDVDTTRAGALRETA